VSADDVSIVQGPRGMESANEVSERIGQLGTGAGWFLSR
jgi:hypothetical protein